MSHEIHVCPADEVDQHSASPTCPCGPAALFRDVETGAVAYMHGIVMTPVASPEAMDDESLKRQTAKALAWSESLVGEAEQRSRRLQ